MAIYLEDGFGKRWQANTIVFSGAPIQETEDGLPLINMLEGFIAGRTESITLHAPGYPVVLSGIGSSITEWCDDERLIFDTDGYGEARGVVVVRIGTGDDAQVIFQWGAVGGSTFTQMSSGDVAVDIGVAGTIHGPWEPLTDRYLNDAHFRWITKYGSTNNAELGNVYLQFRPGPRIELLCNSDLEGGEYSEDYCRYDDTEHWLLEHNFDGELFPEYATEGGDAAYFAANFAVGWEAAQFSIVNTTANGGHKALQVALPDGFYTYTGGTNTTIYTHELQYYRDWTVNQPHLQTAFVQVRFRIDEFPWFQNDYNFIQLIDITFEHSSINNFFTTGIAIGREETGIESDPEVYLQRYNGGAVGGGGEVGSLVTSKTYADFMGQDLTLRVEVHFDPDTLEITRYAWLKPWPTGGGLYAPFVTDTSFYAGGFPETCRLRSFDVFESAIKLTSMQANEAVNFRIYEWEYGSATTVGL